MTSTEIQHLKLLVKKMKRRHPFKWRRYENHVTIVAYIMDALDDLDSLVRMEDKPIMQMNEDRCMKIISKTGQLVQAISLWKVSPYYHQFLQHRTNDLLDDVVSSSYEYAQVMLNMTIADMNKNLMEYISSVKEDFLKQDDENDDEEEMYEIDEESKTINMMKPDEDLHERQLLQIVQLRNEATAKRLIARNNISSLKAFMFYDYIDIIRGVDIITKMKYENKNIAKALGDSTIKFVDIKSSKE